jgi:hypothetical protein
LKTIIAGLLLTACSWGAPIYAPEVITMSFDSGWMKARAIYQWASFDDDIYGPGIWPDPGEHSAIDISYNLDFSVPPPVIPEGAKFKSGSVVVNQNVEWDHVHVQFTVPKDSTRAFEPITSRHMINEYRLDGDRFASGFYAAAMLYHDAQMGWGNNYWLSYSEGYGDVSNDTMGGVNALTTDILNMNTRVTFSFTRTTYFEAAEVDTPEPATSAALLSGLAVLGLFRKRLKRS